MALTLIWEDGSGVPNANSYAQVADGDDYFDCSVYQSPWAIRAADFKAEALIMATRLIDAEFQFNGWRANDSQGLQWPRMNCPDPDRAPWTFSSLLFRRDNFIPSNVVPQAVVHATFEMAQALLVEDRTLAPPGEGIQTVTTGAGATFNSVTYNKSDKRQILTELVRSMLSKFGAPIRGGGSVPLVRT